MENVIEVSNVHKYYRKTPAIIDISLSVKRGSIFGLIGPDGAGKSTLIQIMTGVLSAKSGRVTVLGNDVMRGPESIKSSIGFLPQGLGLSLAQELSVEENIDFFSEINHLDHATRDRRKARLLESMQLGSFRARSAKNLSGGMKQKLALCCTLIHEPELIFLDEPTTGVDPISRRDLWKLINGMVKEKGLTVFFTTSYMDEAARCHEVMLMHKGRIIERGFPAELPLRLDGKFAEIVPADQRAALKELKKTKGVKIAYPMGDKLNCIYKDTTIKEMESDLRKSGVKISSAQESLPGLEDLFLSKIADKAEEVNEAAFEEFFKKDTPSVVASGNVMIKIESLEKRFGSFTAVDRISFEVKRAEIFGFLGPNGAGKTTTIKMLCGLFGPTSGRGVISGLDLARDQFEIKRSIGYMSQRFSLYGDLTVSENIELYQGVYGVPAGEMDRRLDLILKIADLEGKGDVITKDLPMGIKQRLALGCAITHKPPCIFLDEPTSGVDPVARRKFWDIIFLLSRKIGITVLVTTHYMDEAEYCDRVLLMTKGQIVACGEPASLKQRVHDEIGSLIELETSDPFSAVEALKAAFEHCTIYGSRVHLYTKDKRAALIKVKRMLEDKGIDLRGTKDKIMPFEDTFVYFCEHASKG